MLIPLEDGIGNVIAKTKGTPILPLWVESVQCWQEEWEILRVLNYGKLQTQAGNPYSTSQVVNIRLMIQGIYLYTSHICSVHILYLYHTSTKWHEIQSWTHHCFEQPNESKTGFIFIQEAFFGTETRRRLSPAWDDASVLVFDESIFTPRARVTKESCTFHSAVSLWQVPRIS